jgi:hypothetical protein
MVLYYHSCTGDPRDYPNGGKLKTRRVEFCRFGPPRRVSCFPPLPSTLVSFGPREIYKLLPFHLPPLPLHLGLNPSRYGRLSHIHKIWSQYRSPIICLLGLLSSSANALCSPLQPSDSAANRGPRANTRKRSREPDDMSSPGQLPPSSRMCIFVVYRESLQMRAWLTDWEQLPHWGHHPLLCLLSTKAKMMTKTKLR